jgi:NAD(P)-dependent dehydrogenase (short-subunit alcohol dehydrogenase family)
LTAGYRSQFDDDLGLILNSIARFRLDGRTVLITGASSGLGKEIAVACSNAGAKVIAHGRDEDRLNATLAALSGKGHTAVVGDLTEAIQLDRLVEACGDLDGVVHSAGIHGVSPIRLLSENFLSKVFAINYVAPLMLTQRLLAKRKLRKSASVLFLSSIAAKAGKVGVGPYSGSKAAILGTMKPLALEVAKQGIRVNALCPGIVETPLFSGNEDWLREEVSSSYPLGLGSPSDIADAAVFFLADASRKITGTAFSIDGGVPFV